MNPNGYTEVWLYREYDADYLDASTIKITLDMPTSIKYHTQIAPNFWEWREWVSRLWVSNISRFYLAGDIKKREWGYNFDYCGIMVIVTIDITEEEVRQLVFGESPPVP